MTLWDAAWHLLNALAAPFWVALLSATAIKLIWTQEAASHSWISLIALGFPAALAGYLGTWLITGVEGSIAAYAAIACALALVYWVKIFVFRSR